MRTRITILRIGEQQRLLSSLDEFLQMRGSIVYIFEMSRNVEIAR